MIKWNYRLCAALLCLGAGIAGCDPMPMAVTVAPNPVAYVHPGATRPSQPGPVMAAPARPGQPLRSPEDPLVTVPLYTAPVYGSGKGR